MKRMMKDSTYIIENTIKDNLPELGVINALNKYNIKSNVYIFAIGKAAWTMANSAVKQLKEKIVGGIVITKYGHSQGLINGLDIYEAGHPISDENTLVATQKALDLANDLNEADVLLFLVSGGGSALFEKPLGNISLGEIQNINDQLLSSGASITEINTVRKHMSKVKGGRFAQLCMPAKLYTIVLSDVIGDDLEVIASGPAAADQSTSAMAVNILDKYNIDVNQSIKDEIRRETPKALNNVETTVVGSVNHLCDAASKHALSLGYTPYILTTTLDCEAREAGKFFGDIARDSALGTNCFKKPCALIMGGETVVTIKGKGKGGRNQELALSAADRISNVNSIVIFSVGSDGTDGPTDAAGGIVNSDTMGEIERHNINYYAHLENNDSYSV